MITVHQMRFLLCMVLMTGCGDNVEATPIDAGMDAMPDAMADADLDVSQICLDLLEGAIDGFHLHQGTCSDEIDGYACPDAVRVPFGSVGCCDPQKHWHACTMEPTLNH